MKIDGFVTTYKADDVFHIYFYPGKDVNGHVLCKLIFESKDVDYLYTRLSDGAIDYIIKAGPKILSFKLQDIKTGNADYHTIKM